jgi:hypothetical protein
MAMPLLVCCAGVPAQASEPLPVASLAVASLAVEGTLFTATLSDGRVLHSADLVGASLLINGGDHLLRLRIDTLERDPDDKRPGLGDRDAIWLHGLSVQAADGSWGPLCEPGPDGRRQTIPVAGRLHEAEGAFDAGKAGDFELACTGGAIGKCIRFGYHPWQERADIRSFLVLYKACIRMVRADYGGAGAGTTRNGMPVDIYDDRHIQEPGFDPRMTFEAGWTPDGAVCVNHPRVKENISLAQIEARWPRLVGKTGAACTEAAARSMGALLFNRSVP